MGAAAHDLGDVQAAGEGDVGPAARLGGLEPEGLPRLDRDGPIGGHRLPVQGGHQVSAGEGDGVGRVKAQLGAQHGALQHRLVLRVAHQDVGGGRRPGVHDPGDGHAELLIADAAHVLHGGQQAGIQYRDAHCPPSFLGWRLHS